jgi:hypothetical protein
LKPNPKWSDLAADMADIERKGGFQPPKMSDVYPRMDRERDGMHMILLAPVE